MVLDQGDHGLLNVLDRFARLARGRSKVQYLLQVTVSTLIQPPAAEARAHPTIEQTYCRPCVTQVPPLDGFIRISVLAPLRRGQICKILRIDINCFAHPQPVRPLDLFAGQPCIGFGICLPLPGPARCRAAKSPALAVPLHLDLPSLLRFYPFCSVCPFFCHKKTSFGMHLPKPAQKRYNTGVGSVSPFG